MGERNKTREKWSHVPSNGPSPHKLISRQRAKKTGTKEFIDIHYMRHYINVSHVFLPASVSLSLPPYLSLRERERGGGRNLLKTNCVCIFRLNYISNELYAPMHSGAHTHTNLPPTTDHFRFIFNVCDIEQKPHVNRTHLMYVLRAFTSNYGPGYLETRK